MPVFDPILRDWAPGIELILRRGVHYMSFKDGIFQRSIPTESPYTREITIAALSMLLSHPSMTSDEQYTLRTTRNLYIKLVYAHGFNHSYAAIGAMNNAGEHVLPFMLVSDDDRAAMLSTIRALEDMFEANRKMRGIRIPSRGYQFVEQYGKVTKTVFFDVNMHQLVIEGNYFNRVKMLQDVDYYDVPRGGPDNLTLRYLTARFMMTQGCQTSEYNDLAFCDTQRCDVMRWVEVAGPETCPVATDSSGRPIPLEEFRIQQPTMTIPASEVVLTLYGSQSFTLGLNTNALHNSFGSVPNENTRLTFTTEDPIKRRKKLNRSARVSGWLIQKSVALSTDDVEELDLSGYSVHDFTPEEEEEMERSSITAGFGLYQARTLSKRQSISENRASAVAKERKKGVRSVSAAAVEGVRGMGAAVVSAIKWGAAITHMRVVRSKARSN